MLTTDEGNVLSQQTPQQSALTQVGRTNCRVRSGVFTRGGDIAGSIVGNIPHIAGARIGGAHVFRASAKNIAQSSTSMAR